MKEKQEVWVSRSAVHEKVLELQCLAVLRFQIYTGLRVSSSTEDSTFGSRQDAAHPDAWSIEVGQRSQRPKRKW